MTFLSVVEIRKRLQKDFELKQITFTQRKNEKLAIAGASGSGKTTLLRIIAGLIQPDRGKILINGERVKGPGEVLVPGHPMIAYLSQHFELPKFLRVEQVLAYANALADEEARTLFRLCQIDHLLKRHTDELAGGERQRIAVCRLLLGNPKLLLLDEPFAHLDHAHKETLKTVIREIGNRLKITCLLVSHDPVDTMSWADRIIVLQNGRVVQKGTPARIYNAPRDEYVAGLFGTYAVIEPAAQKLFLNGTDRKLSRKPWIVRPGTFRIVARGRGGVRGKVEFVRFLGTTCEAQVRIEDGPVVTVADNRHTLAAGDIVHVAL